MAEPLAKRFEAMGCDMDFTDFEDTVKELHAVNHPAWTDEELLFHPHDGLRFCEVVRRRTRQQVPDDFVLRVLVNARKAGRARPHRNGGRRS